MLAVEITKLLNVLRGTRTNLVAPHTVVKSGFNLKFVENDDRTASARIEVLSPMA